jgi:F-type H+-transporting ATPase subunit delta
MEELIAKRYAKALMEVSDPKKIASIAETLRKLAESMQTQKSAQVVGSPLVSGDEKFDLIVKPLEKKMDTNLFRLLMIMSEKGRLGLVPEMAKILDFEIKRASNSFVGTIESDSTVNAKNIKKMEEALEKYSGAKIKLEKKSGKSDGLKVKVDDLGLEISFSKARVKSDLLAYIQQAL